MAARGEWSCSGYVGTAREKENESTTIDRRREKPNGGEGQLNPDKDKSRQRSKALRKENKKESNLTGIIYNNRRL